MNEAVDSVIGHGLESAGVSVILLGITREDVRDEIENRFSKADSLDRTAKHIATERWKMAEDLIGEDDEDVRRQILAELAVLQRITDVMEADYDVD